MVQVFISDSHAKGHLRSSEVTNRFSEITCATGISVVLLCLYRQYASIHMQYDLLGSPRNHNLRSNFDIDLSQVIIYIIHVSMRLDETNTKVSKSLHYHFKHGSYHRKTVSLKNDVFYHRDSDA